MLRFLRKIGTTKEWKPGQPRMPLLHQAPYYLSPSITKTLSVHAKDNLQQESKNIVLSSPHVGSSCMLYEIVDSLAQDLRCDLRTLEYTKILQFVQKMPMQEIKDRPSRFDKPKLLTFSEAFNPAKLELDDQEFEEEEEEPPKRSTNIFLSLDGFKFGRVENLKKEKVEERRTQELHYSQTLSTEQIAQFLVLMKEDIVQKYHKQPKKLIIFLQDVVDIINVPKDSGKQLVIGIVDLVRHLRSQYKIPILLIAGSSPPLSDELNLQKDYYFHLALFEGIKPFLNGKEQVESFDLLSEGTVFKTNFDSMSDFERIDVFPPSPIFSALGRSNPDAKITRDRYMEYLNRMAEDTRWRIRQINWNNIKNALEKRNIYTDGLDGLEEFSVSVSGHQLPEDYPLLLSTLETNLWNNAKINRLVLHCIANSIQSGSEKVEPKHLIDALVVIYETDTSRISELDITEEYEMEQEEEAIEEEASEETFEESIGQQLKRSNVKLNNYEKKLLGTVVDPKNIPVQMSDLVLLPQTKQVLQSLVTLPLLRPELFKQGVLGRSSINGVLLFGPPGTGKTMLAKAIAKSSGAKFMSVALSDIFEKYVGEGEKNVKAIFTLARKISPCIVFIDEVDALFSARRTNDSNSTRREIMNEFMAEWDGLTSNNNGIIVLGATNRPFDLDDAILRRMPRRVLIDLPTEEARLKILQVHLQGEQVSPDLNLQDLAKRTNLYSGSDLKNLCVAAALQRVKLDILRSFKSKDGSLNEQDVREQVNQIQDWSSMDLQGLEIKTTDLDHYHFEQAMKEITPSLTDEMNSLVELRKWNTQFGDAQKQKKTAWGFVPTKLM